MSPSPLHQPPLPPPQFNLRTLLLGIGVCGVLIALAQRLPPVVVVGISFAALCVVAHVAGNAIGTRLRDSANRERGRQPSGDPWDPSPTFPDSGARQAAPPSRLGERRRLGWPIVIATLAGVFLSGVGGGIWTIFASRGPVGPLNVGVGVVAFAFLGGMVAFALSAFTQVLAGAIWQALRHSEPQR